MSRTFRRLHALALALAFVASAVASPAYARTTFHDLAVAEARQDEKAANLLEVPFYMAGQKHPRVAKDLGTFKSNRRTNAFGKSDERACNIAFLSAIISLQQRAQQEGGDAVVDIKSITRHNDLESASQFRCAAGAVIANVALTGRVVKLK